MVTVISTGIESNKKIETLLYAAAAFALHFLIFKYRLLVKDAAFAHFIWWSVYPIMSGKMARRGVLEYSLLTLGLTLIFLAASPIFRSPEMQTDLTLIWNHAGILAGNIHISLSFYLSKSNPSWIKRLFGQPEVG